MRALSLLVGWSCLLSLALGQTPVPQRTLADVQRTFHEQRDRLYAGPTPPQREQELDLSRRQAAELEAFVTHEATGDDRWFGRLLLADLRSSLRDRDGAAAALRAIDATAAPGIALLNAADLAARLGDQPLRAELLEQALQRPATLEQRLEMARVLMTLLREVARGEKIFADALAAAADDEARALIRWSQCDAIREREDLPENSYFDALEKLAKDLPATLHGSLAKDRAAASQWAIGSKANALRATTIDGGVFELAALRGKAVLLVFWAAADPRSKELVDAVQALRKKHGDDLSVLGVSFDPDPAAFRAECQRLGAAFPQVCDGRGWQTEVAIRCGVEAAPTLIAIDRSSAIAGLNLHVDTKDARDDLDEALQRALRRGD